MVDKGVQKGGFEPYFKGSKRRITPYKGDGVMKKKKPKIAWLLPQAFGVCTPQHKLQSSQLSSTLLFLSFAPLIYSIMKNYK